MSKIIFIAIVLASTAICIRFGVMIVHDVIKDIRGIFRNIKNSNMASKKQLLYELLANQHYLIKKQKEYFMSLHDDLSALQEKYNGILAQLNAINEKQDAMKVSLDGIKDDYKTLQDQIADLANAGADVEALKQTADAIGNKLTDMSAKVDANQQEAGDLDASVPPPPPPPPAE